MIVSERASGREEPGGGEGFRVGRRQTREILPIFLYMSYQRKRYKKNIDVCVCVSVCVYINRERKREREREERKRKSECLYAPATFKNFLFYISTAHSTLLAGSLYANLRKGTWPNRIPKREHFFHMNAAKE
ncbi:hypothetical protein AA313_de0203949 [Arthrobotrys entomopaga]|nr:hypothetical protein AA313_de0203949 [Arthrobotrys entomopaga]